MVCKKNVSNIDWWEHAIKNLPSDMRFSFPLIIIFVDKNIFKQIFDQCPIIFPPNKTIFWGNSRDGKKIKQISIIPK